MRAPQWVSDFFDWRWAPCVGLTAGSLAFVALALLLIPTRFGGEPRVVSTFRAYEAPRSQRAIFSSALTRPETAAEDRAAEVARVAPVVPQPSPQTGEEIAPAPQRGFSPILERAEPVPAPPSPTPEHGPIETPAPTPGTVLIQPVPGGEYREVPQ